jgi:hypothetical protein
MTSTCLSAPETGQWPDENSVQLPGQLCELPEGRQSVAVSLNMRRGEVAQASILVGGPTLGSHLDKWCGMQDSVEP